jgi:hypothetical protein
MNGKIALVLLVVVSLALINAGPIIKDAQESAHHAPLDIGMVLPSLSSTLSTLPLSLALHPLHPNNSTRNMR